MSRNKRSYPFLVHHFLEDSAERFPDKSAVLMNGVGHSFRTIDQAANQLAHFLCRRGLNRGDRVAILLANSPEYIISYYAVLKSGGIAVPLNTDLLATHLPQILSRCGAKILITSRLFRRKLLAIAGDIPSVESIIYRGSTGDPELEERLALEVFYEEAFLQENGEQPPDRRLIDADFASIVYTSGSTGTPRGVTLKHVNVLTNTRSIVSYLQLTPDDRIMAVLPFYYIYGKSLLNTHFSVGGSVVIDNRFAYPNTVLQTMADSDCTGFSGVPSTFAILLHRSALRDFRFPSLRYLTQAGGAMSPDLQKQVSEVFAPARLFVMYGATEASARLSYLDPSELPRKWGSIGKAIPNVELYVGDENGTELPQGEVGEIIARGSNIMSGYWNDPEATARVLRDGCYFTGDLGRMDDEGFIFVVGRKKEMIKRGAHRISSKEIEECALSCPGVMEAAVFGIDDDILGEAIVCCVSLKDSHQIQEKDILDHCKIKLEAYKMPSHVCILPELPKKDSQKIDKSQLKNLFLNDLTRPSDQ